MRMTRDDSSSMTHLVFQRYNFLNQLFDMKDLGSPCYFLRLEVSHNFDGYYLSQVKHALDLISKASLTDSKTT